MGSLAKAAVFSAAVIIFLLLWSTPVHAQTYTVTITVAALPPTLSTTVYVDGVLNGTLKGGDSKSYVFSSVIPGPHTIAVDLYVPNPNGSNGTRYIAKGSSWSFSGGGSNTFTYTTQYYLTVTSQFSTTSGTGWYDSGTAAFASIAATEYQPASNVRSIFTGWGGDATGSGPRSNDILMNKPKVAVANWKTQYLVTLSIDPPGVATPSGAGWFDSGSTVKISVLAVVPFGSGSRYAFTGWTGDFQSTQPEASLVVNGPKAITAHFKSQFQLSISYNPPEIASHLNLTSESWFDARSTVQLGPIPLNVQVSNTERLMFVTWIDNGNRLPGQNLQVVMDSPHTIEIQYKTQYLLRVRTTYGTAWGENWYDKGAKATFGVNYQATTWPINYILAGWKSDGPVIVNNLGGNTWEITMDRSYLVTADWVLDYTPLYLFLGSIIFVIALVASIALITIKRPGFFSSLTSSISRGRTARAIAVRESAMRPCVHCGRPLPLRATFCHLCGRSQEPTRIASPAASADVDSKVYDYIVARSGVISLSQASKDLGISVDELRSVTDRLKRLGKLA